MLACLIATLTLFQQPLKPNPLFSDNMVLQRGMAVPIFGTGTAGQTVTISLASQSVVAKVGDDGKWMAKLAPMTAGGPYELVISAPQSSVTIKNVDVGEVWVCSGQSNMERPESLANDYAQAKDEANADLRMFTVSKVSREVPAGSVRGVWTPASKASVGTFSAVALAFGHELQTKLGVPVGLIQSSWGGTRAEAWTSREALTANPKLKSVVVSYLDQIRDFQAKNEAFKTDLHKWVASRSDNGNEGHLKGWAQPHIYETDWKVVKLPATVDSMEPQTDGKPFDGAVWFRRTFDLPAAWEGKALRIELGPIRDYDDTYFDGTKVGATKEVASDPLKELRSYRVSPGIPVSGQNTIAIRVFAAQGQCGFTGMPEQMRVFPFDSDGSDAINLSGDWFEKVERKVDVSEQAPHMPLGPGSPKAPGGLFNGMIAPLIPYGIKGFIWYQGESNAGEAASYKEMFPTLIRDWRQRWGQADLPFYFVQLANFHPRQEAPSDSDWAELREAQAVALKLPHTGMAVAIDLGEAETIHPANKREVGRRLSLIALSRDYGKHEIWTGPQFQYMTTTGDTVRAYFRHAEDGLKTIDGQAPRGFAVAGADHKFYWASAKIQGEAIVLTCPDVPHPVAVRYGWADNPDCSLYNTTGLPSVPFRTDNWDKNEVK